MAPRSLVSQPGIVADIWHTSAGWILIAFLLLIQFGLFHQYALREVVWAYPTYYDQTKYLTQSYESYEQKLTQGLVSSLGRDLSSQANGVLLHMQASLLFLIIGPSRISALVLNFIYFALLQIALTWVLLWLTRRWTVALLGVGLLLTATTPFYVAGGLFDFRLDFIAFCLFAIFICMVIRSRIFLSWRWSLVAGAVAAAMVFFRFITIVYVSGILVMMAALLGGQLWLQRHNSRIRERAIQRLTGLGIAALLLMALTLPVLWYNRMPIQQYYIAGQLGPTREIRAKEVGAVRIIDALLFYPKSLAYDHLGLHFLIVGILAIVATLVLILLFRANARKSLTLPAFNIREAYTFATVCIVVPLIVLTANTAKSPVVGNIMVPPVLWLFLLTIISIYRSSHAQHARRTLEHALAVLAAVVLSAGMFVHLSALSRHTKLSNNHQDVEQVLQLFDTIGRYSVQLGWDSPKVSIDENQEYLHSSLISPLAYERFGVLLRPQPALGTDITAVTEADAIKLVQNSDFVILTTRQSKPEQSIYPFNQSIQQIRPKLIALCNQFFTPVQRFQFYGREVTLYMRSWLIVTQDPVFVDTTRLPSPLYPQRAVPPFQLPASILVFKGDSGGWITSDGATLIGSSTALQKRPLIELRGKISLDKLGKVPGITAQLLSPNQDPRMISADIEVSGEDYRIIVKLDPESLKADTSVRILVSFDTYFIPKQLGISDDTRQLVLRTPTSVKLLQ